MSKQLAINEQLASDEINVSTPMAMLGRAVESGASMEVIEKLMALHERWEANQARKSYNDAIAAVRAELPVILKTHQAHNYKHEDLGDIARAVDPILAKHGLSYRWRTESAGDLVNVTCVISHRAGHSEENTLSEKRDMSGSKNPIHGLGSTVSYLQRYTLKSALGLAASKDDDAQATGGGSITEQQLNVLQAAIDKVDADVPRLCRHYKIEKIADLPASKYQDAIDKLTAKQSKKAEASA